MQSAAAKPVKRDCHQQTLLVSSGTMAQWQRWGRHFRPIPHGEHKYIKYPGTSKEAVRETQQCSGSYLLEMLPPQLDTRNSPRLTVAGREGACNWSHIVHSQAIAHYRIEAAGRGRVTGPYDPIMSGQRTEPDRPCHVCKVAGKGPWNHKPIISHLPGGNILCTIKRESKA